MWKSKKTTQIFYGAKIPSDAFRNHLCSFKEQFCSFKLSACALACEERDCPLDDFFSPHFLNVPLCSVVGRAAELCWADQKYNVC